MLKYANRIKLQKSQSQSRISRLGDPVQLHNLFAGRKFYKSRPMSRARRKENGGKMLKRLVDHVLGLIMLYSYMEAYRRLVAAVQSHALDRLAIFDLSNNLQLKNKKTFTLTWSERGRSIE